MLVSAAEAESASPTGNNPKEVPAGLCAGSATVTGRDEAQGAVGGSTLVTLEAVRDEMARFRKCGGHELLALEEDLRGLLERQEEAERLAAQVVALVVAESCRPHHVCGATTTVP